MAWSLLYTLTPHALGLAVSSLPAGAARDSLCAFGLLSASGRVRRRVVACSACAPLSRQHRSADSRKQRDSPQIMDRSARFVTV
jgi:hypothetical protein